MGCSQSTAVQQQQQQQPPPQQQPNGAKRAQRAEQQEKLELLAVAPTGASAKAAPPEQPDVTPVRVPVRVPVVELQPMPAPAAEVRPAPTPKLFQEPLPEPEPEPELEPQSLPGGAPFTMSSFSYAANDPCEDRSTTAVHGDNTVFAGVWDGNGGHSVAQYISKRASESFFEAHDMLGSLAAMNTVFPKLDAELLQRATKEPQHRGTLFCGSCCIAAHIDPIDRHLIVGNLGDSRAVLGVFEGCTGDTEKVAPGLGTVVLTRDHSADSELEHQRIEELHGSVDVAITTASDGSCRVKGVAAVTRALGLQHLKVMMPCLAYNKKVDPHNRIHPRPGGPSKLKKGQKTPPFILNEAEVSEWRAIGDSFLILASDGVWDELSCEEAVECVGTFLSQTEAQRAQLRQNVELLKSDDVDGSGAAAVLVEAALRKAHARIVNTLEEEEKTTLEELLARPPGKKDTWPYGRSLLHDDITAVVIEMPLAGVTSSKRCACVASQTRRKYWALGPPPDEEPKKSNVELECESSSEDDYDDSRDKRLRRQTVEAITAEEQAAILDELDDGTGAPRLRRQTVDLDWDHEDQFPLS